MTRLKRLNDFIKAVNRSGWTPNKFTSPISDYPIYHKDRQYIIDADKNVMNFFDETSGQYFTTHAFSEYNEIDDWEISSWELLD